MPRSIDFFVDSSASVQQIHKAFADADYWLARLAHFGGIGVLDTFTVDADGTVTVVVVTDLRRDGLPGPVAKFFPREWRVVQDEKWSPVREGRMRGQTNIVHHGAPMAGAGTALVTSAEHGSRLECEATVQVKVPLIGGTFESVATRLLGQNITAIQGFTTTWIAEHT